MSRDSKSAFWQRHLENCRCSSLSQAEYCKKHSLALATFSYWKKRLQTPKQQEQVRFYPLAVRTTESKELKSLPAGLTILFGKNDVQVELAEDFSIPALKKLLTVLKPS
jgi:hypothetical protein